MSHLAVEEVLEQLLDLRDAGGAADQHHLVHRRLQERVRVSAPSGTGMAYSTGHWQRLNIQLKPTLKFTADRSVQTFRLAQSAASITCWHTLVRLTGRNSETHLVHLGVTEALLDGLHALTEQVHVELLEPRPGDAAVEVDALEQGVDLDARLRAGRQRALGALA